jgi:hypothetical protein
MERSKLPCKERLQAFKLVGLFLDQTPDEFPRAFAQVLVATARQRDDSFYGIALELLALLGETTKAPRPPLIECSGCQSCSSAPSKRNRADFRGECRYDPSESAIPSLFVYFL